MVTDKSFKLPSEGVQNKNNFALISVFCFGKAAETSAANAFCFLLLLWAKGSDCHGMSSKAYSFIKVRVRSRNLLNIFPIACT